MEPSAIATLLEDWQALFGPVPPGAREWRLTGELKARHLKVHSLPGGKRYAECSAETELILERQNTLLDELIGADTPYTVLFTEWSASDRRFVDDRFALLFALDGPDCSPKPPFAWRPSNGQSVRLYARQQPWVRGGEDALLAAIADDEVAGTLLFCAQRNVLFAPYDGGVNLVAASRAQRAELRERFVHWLPGRSEADPTLVIASAHEHERETVRLIKQRLGGTIHLGSDNAVEVVKVALTDVDDSLLGKIGGLSRLQHIVFYPLSMKPEALENHSTSDAGLRALHGLKQLEFLNLEGLRCITKEGVAALRLALPACEVVWDD